MPSRNFTRMPSNTPWNHVEHTNGIPNTASLSENLAPSAGPNNLLSLLISLTLYLLANAIYYFINLHNVIPTDLDVDRPGCIGRWLFTSIILIPILCFTLANTINDLGSAAKNKTTGNAAANFGAMIGVATLVAGGIATGVFDGEIWIHRLFWVQMGAVPGAFAAVVLGLMLGF